MEQKGQKMLGWFRKKPNEKLYAERIYEVWLMAKLGI